MQILSLRIILKTVFYLNWLQPDIRWDFSGFTLCLAKQFCLAVIIWLIGCIVKKFALFLAYIHITLIRAVEKYENLEKIFFKYFWFYSHKKDTFAVEVKNPHLINENVSKSA